MKFITTFLLLFFFLPFEAYGQGTYYNSIDTGSAAFVTDLHNLIYPHTKIAYSQFDETNVVFVSRDTTGGQRVVTCVYSGENFVYTAPFAWTTFSREHTYCHSWMPSWPSDSPELQEYSDQHHLFPTNQNNANGVRSNHPLGVVTNVTSTYLSGKFGTNSSGQTVYEPRSSHKGDAARALLYMSVCYNGVNGKNWSFNYLNNTTLPALGEAPQSVDLLVQWHNQDPPDAWERARNEYIYSIQNNRNPFIDHPEYVGLIDFNTLTKKLTVTLATEPTNYPTNFYQGTITTSSIQLTWSKSVAGAQPPTGYLMIASSSQNISAPTDGIEYSDDPNLSDNSATVNLTAADSFYTFSGLPQATTYYFKLFPYSGYGSSRNYKTDGSHPYQFGLTLGSGASTPSVVVNEYMNGSLQSSEWVELLVLQDNLDMRGMKIRDYSTSGSAQTPLVFSNSSAWSAVRHGTLIVILGNGNLQTQDTSFADKVVIISNANATYFNTGPSGFNIGASADAVEILASDATTHIHSLSHGSYPGLIATLPAPRSNAFGASTSGNVVRFINTSSKSHFADTLHVQHSTTVTQGLPNDATQATFVNTVLPVELVSFTALTSHSSVTLNWRTATETNNHGFEIEKLSNSKIIKFQNSTWEKIGFVEGNGTTNSPKEYSFVDRSANADQNLYRLKQIDRDGSFAYSPTVEVTVIGAPLDEALVRAYPNPFNPSSVISYSVPAAADGALTQLRVFDVMGREVALLVNASVSAGRHSAVFNAASLSSGAYLCVLRTGRYTAATRLLLMK
jgi:endonuclease I